MLNFVEIILALTCFVGVIVAYLTQHQMYHERTKHVDAKYHYVRNIVAQGKLKVCKITHDNADSCCQV